MVWMGVVPVEAMQGGSRRRATTIPARSIVTTRTCTRRELQVYLIDMGDGKVLVMQSWTNFVNKGETADNLKDLGSQFKELPAGWKFRTKVLDKDLKVGTPPPNHLAWVTQDEFQNTYQGCGYDTACSYVP